ncbi:MAG TPA: outer membrane protein assembly factor BamD [Desulfobacteraceae bacterium]|nr:outer membrane protein assembly factor BamD [Desulfobacteraceae bacterium]
MTYLHHRRLPALRPALTVLVLILPLALAGCASLKSWFGFDDSTTVQQSAESLAMEGMDDFNVGKYHSALNSFEEILDRFPFSPQAMLAALKAADSHYYQKNYLEAKVLYQQFEERHPTNEAIPYVMFQIGMCDYARTDRIDRDTSGARDALQSFSRLLRAYPDSPYSAEAKARIQAAQEFLINHEYFVAVFYVRTKRYEEAAHRLRYLIAMYPGSPITANAEKLLARIEEGNPPRMGLTRWLPRLTMPDWKLFKAGETPGPEEPTDL